MKYVSLILLLSSFLITKTTNAQNWQKLFNGKNLKGWNIKIAKHPYKENHNNTFRVNNGLLEVNYSDYHAFDEQYGHIFYKKPYSYYLLEVEYRFIGNQLQGGPGWAFMNSGVMFHSQHPITMGLNQDFPISIEAQFLGSQHLADNKIVRSTSNVCTPGTHIKIDNKLFTSHCKNADSESYHGNDWTKAYILVLGNEKIQHILDKKVVLEYSNPIIGGENVINFDPKIKIDGKILNEGYIALQSESHPIQFRSVRILNLKRYKANPDQIDKILKANNIK